MRFQFAIIRYIPDPLREEFLNIGIILQAIECEAATALIRVTTDWSRVLGVDPDADITVLGEIESDLRRQIAEQAGSAQPIFESLQEGSQGITLSNVRAGNTTNIEAELDRLMNFYVNRRTVK